VSGDALPPASGIICSRNRRQLLRDCVASVLGGDAVPSELIVVDDSDEADPQLAALGTQQGCEVRYLWRTARGLSSAMNFAIDRARHEVLAVTQDDAVVDSTWLERLVRALVAAGPRAIVTGAVLPGEPESRDGFVSAVTPQGDRVVYRERTERDVLYALNMALYRSAAHAIGPFDERLGPGTRFPASEDSDFALRAFDLGYEIVFEPAAVVRHRAWRGGEEQMRLRWGYGYARGGFYAKHLSLRDRYAARRLWHDVRDHVTPLPRLLVREPRRVPGHLALAAGLLAGAMRWLVIERTASRQGGRR
jgi:GT2 family glycosyltransferase